MTATRPALFVTATLFVITLFFSSFLTPIVAAATPEEGDINNDGSVNDIDLTILQSTFAKSAATATAGADINGDGIVDILDLSVLLSNYQTSSLVKGFGITEPADTLFSDSASHENELFDDYQAMRVTWLRTDFNWAYLESFGANSGGSFPGKYRALVNAAKSHNIKIIGTLDYAPQWVHPDCTGTSCTKQPPADLVSSGSATFDAFVTRTVNSYKDGVSTWEIWNEPGAGYYFQVPSAISGDQVAQEYTYLAKGAYQAIKTADPTSKVLVGSLNGATGSGNTLSPVEFIKVMYANGIKGNFDGISLHPYTYSYATEPTTQSCTGTKDPALGQCSWWGGMTLVHNLMVSNGDGEKQIYATEWGYSTTPDPSRPTYHIPEDEIQSYMQAGVSDWKTHDWMAVLFWFSDHDQGGGFGLSGSGYTPMIHNPRWQTWHDAIEN